MKNILIVLLSAILCPFIVSGTNKTNNNSEKAEQILPAKILNETDTSIYGIWKSKNSNSYTSLIWIRKNKPYIIINKAQWDGVTYYDSRERIYISQRGDCLFYYEGAQQKLIYFATYTNKELCINYHSSKLVFQKVDSYTLSKAELLALNNPTPDSFAMFQCRRPPIYGHYHCNDSTIELSEEIDIYPDSSIFDDPVIFKMQQDTMAEKYLEQLKSQDENVRSNAAVELHKLKHPDAISICIRTINDNPDKLHFDYTPSVHCLIQLGQPALLPLLELMLSDNANTRLHALTAIEVITYNMMDANKMEDIATQDIFRDWWKSINLNDEGTLDERKAGINKIKKWLNE